jgi:eukaryotic-like serine/threonine-protein kinase
MFEAPSSSSSAESTHGGRPEARTLTDARPDLGLVSAPPAIAGRYEIGELLGEGGMGLVYAARDLFTGAEIAIKVLREELIGNPDAAARFEREAIHTSALAGPRAVRVLDVGVADSGRPYMAMERLYGMDLDQILQEQGPLPIEQAVYFVMQACEAMKEPHARGIVHRDLKPSNLFAATIDGRLVLKVLDFGISRTKDRASRLTRTLTTIGTPSYMSPEQARCEEDLDERSDVWSLGVILYELVTGTVPFVAASPTATAIAVCSSPPVPPTSYRADLPPAVEAVILRALEKERDKRYPSVGALAAALEPTVIGPLLPTLRTTVDDPRAERRSRRRRFRLLAAAAGTVLGLTMLFAANADAPAGTAALASEAPVQHDVTDVRTAEVGATLATSAVDVRVSDAPVSDAPVGTPSLVSPLPPVAPTATVAPAPVGSEPSLIVDFSRAAPSSRPRPVPTPPPRPNRRPKFDERF